jgi:hypothetical protein
MYVRDGSTKQYILFPALSASYFGDRGLLKCSSIFMEQLLELCSVVRRLVKIVFAKLDHHCQKK